MSGVISGIDYSLLLSTGSSSASSINAAILKALYSGTSGQVTSTFVSSGNPLADLTLAKKQQATDVALVKKQPAVLDAITRCC
jgi:hypothetical protein